MHPRTSRPGCWALSISFWATILTVFSLTSRPARSQNGTPQNKTVETLRLRDKIDRFFENDLPGNSLSSDSEFLRRVSIDLTGMPPTLEQTRTFLDNNSEEDTNKRERWVDHLMSTPQFDRHMVTLLDITLMERRGYKVIKEAEWQAFLLQSVRDNQPWNQLARKILEATGEKDDSRAAVRFAMARDAEPNLMTRDIGRIFFGKDLQCAQCHNHPLVDDYLQSDYQGLLAFVAPGFIKTIQKPGAPGKNGKPGKPVALKIYAEKDGNDINFESVFIKNTKHRTGPRIIGEVALLEPDRIPVTTAAIEKSNSRRAKLAELATNGSNISFNQNIANRLWAHLFGRGLVYPSDFHHRDNPPVKPALMKFLGEQIVELNFDMRAFLKEIALSKVYQRSFAFPESQVDLPSIRQRLSQLGTQKKELDQKTQSAIQRQEQANNTWQQAETKFIPIAIEVEKFRKELATHYAAEKKLNTELAKLDGTYRPLADAQKAIQDTKDALDLAGKSAPADKEVASLLQRVTARLAAIEKQVAPLEKKRTESIKKQTASKAKSTAILKNLKSGFEKRRPLRNQLDESEKLAREARSEVESLVTQRTAIESEIATYERFEKLLQHRQEAQPVGDEKKTGNPSQDSDRATQLEASLTSRFSKNYTMAPLKPLTPEQLCWSVLRVTGVYDRTLRAEESKIRKSKSIDPKQPLSFPQQRQVEENTVNALKGHLANFIRYYGAGAGQPQGDFFATADQALFFLNHSTVNSYLNPSSGNVTDLVSKAGSAEEAANILYLSILSRNPTTTEIEQVKAYLSTDEKNRAESIREITWCLLNSVEFRFNH